MMSDASVMSYEVPSNAWWPVSKENKKRGLICHLQIINKLLAYKGYAPAMRDLFPSNFLRAELLKAVMYPEISYRKFCDDDKAYKGHKEHSPYIGMDNKM